MNHATMAREHPPCDMTGNDHFVKQGGITNGAAWYSVAGGKECHGVIVSTCIPVLQDLKEGFWAAHCSTQSTQVLKHVKRKFSHVF